MSLHEDQTVAFVIRIWRERNEVPTVRKEWRGVIEHVESGQKTFFRDLKPMVEFMNPYLDQLGIDTGERFWEMVDPWTEAGQDLPAATPTFSGDTATSDPKPKP